MKEEEKREFYKGLRERIKQLRMQHLFEEPCPLYEDDEDETETLSVKTYELYFTLCLSPLVIVFLLMKFIVWISAVNSEQSYVRKESHLENEDHMYRSICRR